VFPAHSENFLLVSHPRITHDHQHIAKRLLAERQKLGFHVGVNNALPCVFLHEFDLWRSLDDVPFLGLSEHSPEGAQSIIVT
jgi:hypothetical protein